MRHCLVKGHSRSGVTCQQGGKLWLHCSTVCDNTLCGLKVTSHAPCVVSRCHLRHNAHMGMLLRDFTHVWAVACCFSHNRGAGIACIHHSRMHLSGTSVANNEGYGIVCQHEARITIQRCHVAHNQSVGTFATQESIVGILGTTIERNGVASVRSTGTASVRIMGTNWVRDHVQQQGGGVVEAAAGLLNGALLDAGGGGGSDQGPQQRRGGGGGPATGAAGRNLASSADGIGGMLSVWPTDAADVGPEGTARMAEDSKPLSVWPAPLDDLAVTPPRDGMLEPLGANPVAALGTSNRSTSDGGASSSGEQGVMHDEMIEALAELMAEVGTGDGAQQ